jgi:hypothetical protein
MARRPVPIRIKPKDLAQIGQLLRRGIQQVRVVLRALALRQLAEGVTAPRVAQTLPLTPKAVRQIAHRYKSNGLDGALYDKQRPGPKQILDDSPGNVGQAGSLWRGIKLACCRRLTASSS